MIINILFKLLNFSVIVALFYYVIRNYVIPFVTKMMTDYDLFIHKLKDDRQIIKKDCQKISEKIDQQEEQLESMQLKFVLWQEKCRDEHVLQMIDQEHIVKKIHHRVQSRSQVVMNQLAIKKQLPYILDRATKKLQEKYHHVDAQKKYTQDLIHVMKEQL